MTTIQENVSLKKFNSFGVEAKARYFAFYKNPNDIKYLISDGPLSRDTEMIILGGGTNQLFVNDFGGVVIHPINDEIELIAEDTNFVYIKAGAGLEWDKLVLYAVNKGYGGIENLSDIPGNLGASPVQNIGAYGVEAKDTIHEVHLVSFHDGSTKTLSNCECNFGYRTSIFKNKLKNRYLVDSVTFRLTKNPVFVTHYGNVQQELEKKGTINLKNIRETIIEIRNSKLPKPSEIGNAGSFFKNPVIPESEAHILKQQFPEMPFYPSEYGQVKLAAGWLIEQCGLKGYSLPNGKAGVHDKQALVIVNKGNATGAEILEVSHLVQLKVFEKFDINLEPEVIIV